MPFWSTTLARQGLGFAPLQADWVKARIDMPEEELLADLRLLLATGEVFSAARGQGAVVTRDGARAALRCGRLLASGAAPSAKTGA